MVKLNKQVGFQPEKLESFQIKNSIFHLKWGIYFDIHFLFCTRVDKTDSCSM